MAATDVSAVWSKYFPQPGKSTRCNWQLLPSVCCNCSGKSSQRAASRARPRNKIKCIIKTFAEIFMEDLYQHPLWESFTKTLHGNQRLLAVWFNIPACLISGNQF